MQISSLIMREKRHILLFTSVQIQMPDRVVQRSYDSFFPGEEVRSGQIGRNCVMCNEITVHRQILYESLQLFQHFLLRKRIELTAARLFQKRSAGEQDQSAGPDKHRFAPAEDLRGINGMLMAVRPSCDAI